MLNLASLGWGAKRKIAKEMDCSRNTARRYLRHGYQAYRTPLRTGRLQGIDDWLAASPRAAARQRRCGASGSAARDGVKVSLRPVERAVRHLRREAFAQRLATVRFETAAGQQLQIHFGSLYRPIDDESTRIFLFVATLGYSRRTYVDLFLHERQSAWMQGLEGAFRHFDGTTKELLIDNAKPLAHLHRAQTREVVFNERFRAFRRSWDIVPRSFAPYRVRTKGKDERGVGYVKHNAIAGHRFASLEAVRSHLSYGMREIADVRIHGTTGKVPQVRFDRDERQTLRSIDTGLPYCKCVSYRAARTATPAANSTPIATARPGGSSVRASRWRSPIS